MFYHLNPGGGHALAATRNITSSPSSTFCFFIGFVKNGLIGTSVDSFSNLAATEKETMIENDRNSKCMIYFAYLIDRLLLEIQCVSQGVHIALYGIICMFYKAFIACIYF